MLNNRNVNQKCLVIANGPSSKLVDVASVRLDYDATNSMNSSFRTWIDTDYRPTHFTALDSVLTKTLAKDICSLIEEGRIEHFLLDDVFASQFPEYAKKPNVLLLSDARRLFAESGNGGMPITTGTWAIRWMIQQGYKNVDIVGMDGIRLEMVENSMPSGEGADTDDELTMAETPKFNPNYYSSAYQKKGDKYRIPNNGGHLINNFIKLHDHAFLAVKKDVEKSFPGVVLRDFSTNSFHQIFRKQSIRGRLLKRASSAADVKGAWPAFLKVYSDVLFDGYGVSDGLSFGRFFHLGKPCVFHESTEKEVSWHVGQYLRYIEEGSCYADRPTIPIVISNDKVMTEVNNLIVMNGIRNGAIFEWEIYGREETDLPAAIELLDLSGPVTYRLQNYAGNIFCNFAGDPKVAEQISAFRLALKDYLFHCEDKEQNSGKVEAASDIERMGDQTLQCSFLDGGVKKVGIYGAERYELKAGQMVSLLIKHRYLDVRSVRLDILCESVPGQQFKVNLQSYSKLSRLQRGKDSIVQADAQGLLHIKLDMQYEDDHVGLVANMIAVGGGAGFSALRPTSGTLLLMDKAGQSFSRSLLLTDPASPVLQDAEFQVERIILIEPDLSNKQGHFYAYANNFHKTAKQHDLDFVVLSNLEVNEEALQSFPEAVLVPTFSKNTWTIATSRDVFRQELSEALGRVRYNPDTDVVYMYTGSIFHAIEIQNLVQGRKAHITCDLFWEMIKDVGVEYYVNGFKELREALDKFEYPISLVSPTKAVEEMAKSKVGYDAPLAPHPSTSVHDETAKDSKLSEKKLDYSVSEKQIFFPGVNTMHKGYEYGVELAAKLAGMGYKCYVRDVGFEERVDSLTYLPLGMSEEEINSYFEASHLIVVPYMPEGFANRTSGLAVDALLHGKPLAAIKGTWLGDHVDEYQAGLVVDTEVDSAAKDIDAFLNGYGTSDLEKLGEAADRYHREHSWDAMLNMITT